MARAIRDHDWAATSLGRTGVWPQSLKTLVDLMLASPSMMSLVWGADAIHLYNDRFAELLGEHQVQPLGRSAWETFARSRDVFAADLAAGMSGKSGTLTAQRYPVLRHGRLESAWFDVDYAPVRDETGGIAGVLWTLKETTAKVLADGALRESEARHRLLIGSWAQAVWETDSRGVVVSDSPSWRAYTGQALEEWLGYGWLDAIHPDDRAYAEQQWHQAIASGGLVDAEYRLRAPDRGWRWTNVRAAPVLDAAGQIEKWAGINIDIDARKRAETTLQESEEKYRALFQSMDEAYAVVEVLKDATGRWTDFRFVNANRAFMEHTSMPYPVGRTATELLGTPNPRWTELYGQALDTGKPIRIEEAEPTLGRTFDLNIFCLDRARARVAVLFTDITERKTIEAALRASEDQFRTLADTAPALIWRSDAKGGNLFVNRYFLAFTGKRAEDVSGSGWHALVHPDDARSYVTDYLKAVDARRAWQRTARVRRHDGEWRWFEHHARPLMDHDGGYLGHVGVSVDITDRVDAERTLRKLQERQAFLLKLSDALKPILDAAEVQATTTRQVAEHLGVDRSMYAEVEGAPGAETGTIRAQFVRSPADGGPAASFPASFAFDPFGKDAMAIRYRGEPLVVRDVTTDPAFTAAERTAWQQAQVGAAIVVPLVKGGRLVAEFGVHCVDARDWTDEDVALVRDVAERTWSATERARAEDALRESEQRFRQFGEYSCDAIWIVDAQAMRLDYLSPAYERIWGESREPVMADIRRWAEAVHPDDLAMASTAMPRLLAGQSFVAEYRIIRPDGEVRWIRDAGFPIKENGVVKRGGGVAQDITALKRIEAALTESEAKLRNFGEASRDILWIRDAKTLQWEYLTPSFEPIYGVSRAEALTGNNYRSWLDMVIPEDRRLATEMIQRVRDGEHVSFEFRIRRPTDGAIRWLRNTDFPIMNEHGDVTLIGGIGHDWTELRATRSHLEALIDNIPQLVWRADDPGNWTWASPQWTAFTGQSGEDSRGWGWLEPLHPDDRDTARAAWAGAEEHGAMALECRICERATGSYRWFQTRASPLRDRSGAIVEWFGTSTDIDDLRRLHGRQEVLVKELQHRTFNLMGMIRSTADATIRSSVDLADFRRRFRDRINALARVQRLLSRLQDDDRVTFHDLIHAELDATGVFENDGQRVTLEGPRDVALRSGTVQTFAMALHELTTNAVKYGALNQPGGHLHVRWRVEADEQGRSWLHVDWHETGVVMPPEGASPGGTGLGRALIEKALPYQLNARTTYVMAADGVRCTIALPASTRGHVEASDATHQLPYSRG